MSTQIETRLTHLENTVAKQTEVINTLLEDRWAHEALLMVNPKEESFPASLAKEIVTGENPIKVYRKYRGMTQQELAEICGTSTAYISQIETGNRSSGLDLTLKIAKALRVDIEDIT